MSKFFIPLGMRYGGDKHPYSRLHCVYGPYPSTADVEAALMRLYPNDKTEQFIIFDGNIVKVPQNPEEKPDSEKRQAGDYNFYINLCPGKYICKTCEGPIIAATVAHSVHDGPFPLSGSGRVETSQEPYCPNCEIKPNYYGSPISG